MSKSSTWTKIRHFLTYHFVTLYYFQEYVDLYKVHYDRKRFRRVFEYLERGFCMFQYRKLYPQEARQPLDYPLYVTKRSLHLQFPTYFFFCYLIRSLSIVNIKWFTETRQRRILFGTEMFQKDSVYFESSFVLWSIIVFSFYRFAMTNSLLNYKFLSLLRMTNKRGSKYLRPNDFDLEEDEYRNFAKFRSICSFMYVYTMASLVPGCPLGAILLCSNISLYSTNPVAGIIWTIIIGLWCFYVCAILYSNYITLILVAKYLHIKQKSISYSIEQNLSHIKWNRQMASMPSKDRLLLQVAKAKTYSVVLWKRFLDQNSRYTRLQDEMQDYNRFWSTALSSFVLNYILLISFIIYVVFISGTTFYLKGLYGTILFFHIVLLSTIIKYTGDIVLTNVKLATTFRCAVARFVQSPLATVHLLKLCNMSQYLSEAQSGFILLNGYMMNHNTFRDIISNIGIYFLLIIKK